MERLKAKDKIKVTRDDIELEFEVAEEGGYVVSVPDLPGCISEGETFEEALAMIQDAIAGWLLVAQKHGDPIPGKFKRFLPPISSQGARP